MIVPVLLGVAVAVVVWQAPSQPRFQDAHDTLVRCVQSGGGPGCYQQPAVQQAIAQGWVPPSYYRIIEGEMYHQ